MNAKAQIKTKLREAVNQQLIKTEKAIDQDDSIPEWRGFSEEDIDAYLEGYIEFFWQA